MTEIPRCVLPGCTRSRASLGSKWEMEKVYDANGFLIRRRPVGRKIKRSRYCRFHQKAYNRT